MKLLTKIIGKEEGATNTRVKQLINNKTYEDENF